MYQIASFCAPLIILIHLTHFLVFVHFVIIFFFFFSFFLFVAIYDWIGMAAYLRPILRSIQERQFTRQKKICTFPH